MNDQFTPDELMLISMVVGNRAHEVQVRVADGKSEAWMADTRYAEDLLDVAMKAERLRQQATEG